MIEEETVAEKEKEFLEDNKALKKFLEKHEMKTEYDEVQIDTWGFEPYPAPIKKYRMILEEHEESLEGMYYWMLTSYRQDWGFTRFDKVIDVFAASEQSSFFGVSQQRLGLQQDKVSQFLQAAGKMIKEIFQFVRELRIIDERLEFYRDTYSSDLRRAESADITLKGIWIDMVQGGAKNPASVYGLAREVGFTILPDLFFSVRPQSSIKLEKKLSDIKDSDLKNLFQGEVNKLDETVDRLEFNRKVREVLKRKLREFLEWKKMTFNELLTRRRFTLQYFRQHYDIIRLYMSWIKPYLRNIRRMQFDQKKMDSVDMVGAFEGSMIEVEFLASKTRINMGRWYAVGLMNFLYRTRAMMNYQQDYQRGPKHSGKCTMTMRAYVWTKEQLEDYIKMRQEEDLELIATIDSSLKEAMDALGDDMKAYLAEAGEKLFKDEAEKKKKEAAKKKPSMAGAADPFISIFKGFGELAGAFTGGGSDKAKKPKIDLFKEKKQKKLAETEARTGVWRGFKNYRKAHKIITW